MVPRFAVILGLISLSAGYRVFQDRIPNGGQVPHPCKPNFVWRGVGHRNPLGGGPRNPFGLDFDRHNTTWTRNLCEADSDGDGLTNGQELGDPDCNWKPGTFPKRHIGISHPGVCDPWGNPKCQEKNADVTCDTGKFDCPYVEEPDVRNFTLRFPKTVVPAEETSYMCMSFDLEFPDGDPQNQEYHIIATEPIIDNPNVMHHIVLTTCTESAKKVTQPTLCYMAQDGCSNAIGLWTLGMSGECIYKDAGFRIGGGSKTTVMMQFHWTNPERVPDYEDGSGMIVYYTPNLRKHNAGLFTTGELKLEIPPGQARVVVTSTCSSDCTERNINGGVFITTGLNHMHYLGVQQNVELYRDDKKIRDLTKEDVYSYDNPVIHEYNPPQLLLPGDRMETTCVYRSLSKTRTTYFGEGTYDEMCFGIFTIFPVENATRRGCTTWGNIETCRYHKGHIYDCNRQKFNNLSDPETVTFRHLVLDNCNFHGSCRPECPAALAKVREDPCLQEDVGDYMLWSLSLSKHVDDIKFLAAMASCDCPADKAGKRAIGILESNAGQILNLPTVFVFIICAALNLVMRY